MGAGQSKQPTQPLTASSAAETAASSVGASLSSATSSIPNVSNAPANASTDSSSSPKEGGCPMKNADGSYRIMPGFSSLLARMAGHPPVDASRINVESETAPVSAAASGANNANASNNAPAPSEASGCPVKQRDGSSSSSRGWNTLRRGGSGPGSDNLQSSGNANNNNNNNNNDDESACPVKNHGSSSTSTQQYDVYSRPLPMDPTNNMPVANPTTVARNSLPSPDQNEALPTERVSSSIPKARDGNTTWTYPSPQMFYNALARKGKLDDDTKEEDMISVVAIHNCMNEGTWGRVMQWEKVLGPQKEEGEFDGNYGSSKGEAGDNAPGPSLTKFMGRPTDLSPKAFFKHYLLNHPLPFDRHDWTVTRTNADGSTNDVRYVIDYYHDDLAAKEEEGSGLPKMNEGIGEGGRIQSLLVDVRPAADSPSEVWGRMVTMPLARRGCRSVLECVLFKGSGSGKKSEFEPLSLSPNDSLKQSVGDSQEVWENIQKDAAAKKGVGAKDEACVSDAMEGDAKKVEDVASAAESGRTAIIQPVPTSEQEEQITKPEATKLAESFSNILSKCQDHKTALQTCSSDAECNKAFMGMTACAGQFMCPLQHSSLMDSLDSMATAKDMDVAEATVNQAFGVLGECVANYDGRASVAKKQFPEVFDEVLKKGK